MKTNKIIKVFLLLLINIVLFSVTVFSHGWEQDEYGNWRYKDKDGSYVKNAKMASGNQSFYLNDEGYIEKDFFWQTKNYAYYFSSNGAMVRNTNILIKPDTKSNERIEKEMTLYFDDKGRCKKVNGEWMGWQDPTKVKNSSVKYYSPEEEMLANETAESETILSPPPTPQDILPKNDDKQERIAKLNQELYLLSCYSPYEGLYYSDVRKKISEANHSTDIFRDFHTQSTYNIGASSFVYDPSREINYKDVIIPLYNGTGEKLSEDEKKFAMNFESNYECKTFGDVMYDMISHNRDVFTDGWKDLVSMDSNLGHYLFLGRIAMSQADLEKAKTLMFDVDEFNVRIKKLYYTNGFFSNYLK